MASLIGLQMTREHGDVPFQLVLLSAFNGIANKHVGPGGMPDAALVIHGARVAAVARQRRRHRLVLSHPRAAAPAGAVPGRA